jgi:DNA-binding NtrC family response regulator
LRTECGMAPVNWLMGKKVLLVDDDEMIRNSMRLFFDAKGCHYRARESAEGALQTLASESYDLIVSDYKLPGMDGLEFFESIRLNHPTVAKMLITAYASPGLFSRAERMGITGCIEKPLTAEKVESCLALIGRKRAAPG